MKKFLYALVLVLTLQVVMPMRTQAASVSEAQAALEMLLEQKTVMATVYMTDSYEVKMLPEWTAETVGKLYSGAQVFIQGVESNQSGVWYQVLFAVEDVERTGYIEAEYLVTADVDFLTWETEYLSSFADTISETLVRSGNQDILAFPSSYQRGLAELKSKHPNWVFVPFETNLNWDVVVNAQMQNSRSWVFQSKHDSWKGEKTAQNGWYLATREAVEYCLDPRNFLDEDYVFMFEQLTYNAQFHSEEAVQNILNTSFMKGKIPDDESTYAKAFFDIGKDLGVSPFHLACRVLQEQGSQGGSALISGTYKDYEGLYNYFNVGATGTTTTDVIRNGLISARNKGWTTRRAALAGGAEFISKNYILKGQDTLYLQKFDVDASYHGLFSHQYMQNISAPMSEGNNIRAAYGKANSLNNTFVFKIPVYKNMPEQPCGEPGTLEYEKAEAEKKLRAFVVRLYEDALGRESYVEAEVDEWFNYLNNKEKTGAEVAQGFFFSAEFTNKGLADEEFVELLYKVMFDRESDEGGKTSWLEKLEKGMSRDYVYQGFANSQEFANVCGEFGVIQGVIKLGNYRDLNEGVTFFVNRLYNKLLARQGEEEGIENWCRVILEKEDTVENVAAGFVFSQEFLNKETDNEEFVELMYQTFFDRASDLGGFNNWMAQLNQGADREAVFRGFTQSTEFENLLRQYGLLEKAEEVSSVE